MDTLSLFAVEHAGEQFSVVSKKGAQHDRACRSPLRQGYPLGNVGLKSDAEFNFPNWIGESVDSSERLFSFEQASLDIRFRRTRLVTYAEVRRVEAAKGSISPNGLIRRGRHSREAKCGTRKLGSSNCGDRQRFDRQCVVHNIWIRVVLPVS